VASRLTPLGHSSLSFNHTAKRSVICTSTAQNCHIHAILLQDLSSPPIRSKRIPLLTGPPSTDPVVIGSSAIRPDMVPNHPRFRYAEVVLTRDLLADELDICWEIPASPVNHRIAARPHPDKSKARQSIVLPRNPGSNAHFR
jgi:hypothetical protein